ncbi:MAG: hypothetical protein NDF57_06470, partial [archaeon GBS-70-058]|nr:hypothetical protein [Candidatus Culexarchaeum nevadense]
MRSLKIEDYNRFTSVCDPQISPDGKRVAFVTIKPEIQENNYKARIWVINLDNGEIELTTNG